jgi:hypothetical protein
MKNPFNVSILLFCLLAFSMQAQDKLSWKKHLKLAESLYAKAQYADAGEHYRAAFKQKTKKKELAFKAGECFFFIRDYRNAADSWQHIKDDNLTYPLIGLRYARCLKQNGDYEAASSELVNFLGNYQGTDKSVISQIVQNELRGCELAAKLAVQAEDENIVVEHLSSNINTPETEFAPFPFGDEALYFSSTMAKRAEIYRSLKVNGDWSKATPIENFPVVDNDHFCNGTLTSDAKRFYFTICKSVESWGGLTTQCQIYVTRRVGNTWTSPERLPDYVNEPGMSSTHPYVVHDGNTEILYFSSNRKGGMGGMDIWYTTREINSNANDFTLPINTGSRINTLGDEITPYYDLVNKTLYFASNGQISIGGYDIFKVKGGKSEWNKTENAGKPFNSPADDFFFIKTTSGKSGFFVSNRTFGMEKISTTNEDIFSFELKTPERRWVAKGEIFDKTSMTALTGVDVSLYEVTPNSQKRFLSKIYSENGTYEFEVEPAKKYHLEAIKDGFFPYTKEIDTRDYANYDDFGVPVYMESHSSFNAEEAVAKKDKMVKDSKKVPVNDRTNVPAKVEEKMKVEEESQPYATRGKSKTDNLKIVTEAPRQSGTYFKIQVIALSKFDQNQSRYSKVKNMGRLDTEYIMERKLYRVLLADYASIDEARADLVEVRKMKDFKDAFIVEYKDGERIGTVE